MEISVGFADKDECNERSDLVLHSVLGKVYIPREGVDITGAISIRYEKHPWIEQFEVDGVVPLTPRRTGYGTKTFEAFVQSLAAIYAHAYDDFATFPDEAGYFKQVTERFVQEYSDEVHRLAFEKYCGFVENLWREGTEEIHDVAMKIVLPIIMKNGATKKLFDDTITGEFRKYIGEYNG